MILIDSNYLSLPLFLKVFSRILLFFLIFLVGYYLYFSYFSMNEPELGAGIDPGMAFNPFPSSILDKMR